MDRWKSSAAKVQVCLQEKDMKGAKENLKDVQGIAEELGDPQGSPLCELKPSHQADAKHILLVAVRQSVSQHHFSILFT